MNNFYSVAVFRSGRGQIVKSDLTREQAEAFAAGVEYATAHSLVGDGNMAVAGILHPASNGPRRRKPFFIGHGERRLAGMTLTVSRKAVSHG